MPIIALTLLLAATAPCPGSTTREVEQCLADDLARADSELNRYYAAAVKRLASEREAAVAARLRSSELAWIRYRDAECDAVWEYWKGGTIRGTFSTECRLRLTRARTMTIWSNWLTYMDTTPPLLPKPAMTE
jgi:uncharacterized protein YecT (DUF1311 family)